MQPVSSHRTVGTSLRSFVCAAASLFVLAASVRANAADDPVGFGMGTAGGLEGRVIRVTSLEREGPGTLRAAIEA
jgi:hypothetical protein